MIFKNKYKISALFVIIWVNIYYSMEKKISLKKFAGRVIAYTDNIFDTDSYQIQNDTSKIQYGYIEENPAICSTSNQKTQEYIVLRLIKSESGYKTKTLTFSKTYLKNNKVKIRNITHDEASELACAIKSSKAHFSHAALDKDPITILEKMLTDKKNKH